MLSTLPPTFSSFPFLRNALLHHDSHAMLEREEEEDGEKNIVGFQTRRREEGRWRNINIPPPPTSSCPPSTCTAQTENTPFLEAVV